MLLDYNDYDDYDDAYDDHIPLMLLDYNDYDDYDDDNANHILLMLLEMMIILIMILISMVISYHCSSICDERENPLQHENIQFRRLEVGLGVGYTSTLKIQRKCTCTTLVKHQ